MKALLKLTCKLSCLVAALASINMGLIPYGYDLFTQEAFVERFAQFIVPLHYIIGICGAISLIGMLLKMAHGCGCGSACGRCGGMSGCNCK